MPIKSHIEDISFIKEQIADIKKRDTYSTKDLPTFQLKGKMGTLNTALTRKQTELAHLSVISENGKIFNIVIFPELFEKIRHQFLQTCNNQIQFLGYIDINNNDLLLVATTVDLGNPK